MKLLRFFNQEPDFVKEKHITATAAIDFLLFCLITGGLHAHRRTVYSRKTITVHLGAPDSDAANVTVDFPTYIKNVASSEIYPTSYESALRANIYAIISFALNRIYTEWYRSRGYDFDITASTQFDQKFINNREIFENISDIVDEIFNDYVVRQGNIEPLFTSFCNGTTVTCSLDFPNGVLFHLQIRALHPYEILQYYYGDNINIVKDAPLL